MGAKNTVIARLVALAIISAVFSFSSTGGACAQVQARICIGDYVKEKRTTLGFDLPEAERIILDVAKSIGLSADMKLVACRFDKVSATYIPPGDKQIPEGEYITYNPDWVREVIGSDRIQLISLLGHEMGHFLNRHFTTNRTVPDVERETQADRFAGCAVARMKGDWKSLEGLLSRVRTENAETYYPNRLKSLSAAREGFEQCGGSIDVASAPSDLVPSLKPDAKSLCSNLLILNKAGDTGFDNLKGSQSDANTWSARFTLPGFERCSVAKFSGSGRPLYACYGSASGSKPDIEKRQETFKAQAASCLGQKWVLSPSSLGGTLLHNAEEQRSLALQINEFPTLSDPKKKTYYNSVQLSAPPARYQPIEYSATTRPEGYCEQLKTITEQAPAGFNDLLGAKKNNWYVGRTQLSGWQDCTISDLDGIGKPYRSYSCALPNLQDKSSAVTLLAQIAGDLKTCLSPIEWSGSFRKRYDGTPSIRFTSTIDGTEVQLRIRESDGLWQTKVDVDQSN